MDGDVQKRHAKRDAPATDVVREGAEVLRTGGCWAPEVMIFVHGDSCGGVV